MVHNLLLEQPAGLLSMLPEGSSEVDIEHMQFTAAYMDVGAQASARLTAGFGDVVIPFDLNRKTAEYDIAVASATDSAILAKRSVKAQIVGNITELVFMEFAAFEAQYFLQRNNVCVDLLQNVDDSVRTHQSIQTATFVYVVSDDSNRVRGLLHCVELTLKSFSPILA